MRTDRHDEANFAFRNFANKHKNGIAKEEFCLLYYVMRGNMALTPSCVSLGDSIHD